MLSDYIYNKPTIETDRCILRPMRADAAVNFHRRLTFPVKIRYTIKGRHKPVAMQR